MINLEARLRFVTGLVAVLTLVACGGPGHKIQSKVDNANGDYQRVQAIDVELRSMGLSLNDPERSNLLAHGLDAATLRRARSLLNEFTTRGENVMTISQRKDVQIKNGDMSTLENFLRQASRLKITVNEVLGQRTGAVCPDQGSTAIARQSAKAYVRGLGNDVLRETNWDDVRTEKVENECDLYRVIFRSKRDPSLRLKIIVNQASVLRDRSDDGFQSR